MSLMSIAFVSYFFILFVDDSQTLSSSNSANVLDITV